MLTSAHLPRAVGGCICIALIWAQVQRYEKPMFGILAAFVAVSIRVNRLLSMASTLNNTAMLLVAGGPQALIWP